MLQFSLANCVKPFLQCVSFSTGTQARGYYSLEWAETDTDSDSDCEL